MYEWSMVASALSLTCSWESGSGSVPGVEMSCPTMKWRALTLVNSELSYWGPPRLCWLVTCENDCRRVSTEPGGWADFSSSVFERGRSMRTDASPWPAAFIPSAWGALACRFGNGVLTSP